MFMLIHSAMKRGREGAVKQQLHVYMAFLLYYIRALVPKIKDRPHQTKKVIQGTKDAYRFDTTELKARRKGSVFNPGECLSRRSTVSRALLHSNCCSWKNHNLVVFSAAYFCWNVASMTPTYLLEHRPRNQLPTLIKKDRWKCY